MKQITKRLVSAVMAAAIAISKAVLPQGAAPLSVTAAAEQLTTVPEGYVGIYDVDDLYGMNNDPDGNYILMNDIDLTEATAPGGDYDNGNGWTPLFQGEGSYYSDTVEGVFDGNGHKITGLQIYGIFDEISKNYEFGLFATCGTVKNLYMENVNIDVEINGAYSRANCGAIAGRSNGEIVNCTASGKIKVIDYDSSVGGIVGMEQGFMPGTINCYNTVIIDSNSEATGPIKGDESGGTETSYSIGKVTGDNRYYNEKRDSQCYALKGTTPNTPGYTELTAAQMKKATSFTGFDFENTWEIDPYCGYDYPQLKSCRQVRLTQFNLVKVPTKTNYFMGEELNLSGSEIELVYDNDTSVNIEIQPDMVSGFDTDKKGTQKINVEWCGKKVCFEVKVRDTPVSSIVFDKTKATVNKGRKYQINATVGPDNATDKTLTWTTSDKKIATVSQNGLVTTKKSGIVTITATAASGISEEFELVVILSTKPSKSAKMNYSKLSLDIKDKKKLKVTMDPVKSTDKITWYSSDSKIVSVTQKGTIKAKKVGTATITAVTSSGKTAKCVVTVNPTLTLEKYSATIKKGKTYQIKAATMPKAEIEYEVTDPTIASVDENGKIKGVGKGKTTIFVTSNYLTKVFTVTVK